MKVKKVKKVFTILILGTLALLVSVPTCYAQASVWIDGVKQDSIGDLPSKKSEPSNAEKNINQQVKDLTKVMMNKGPGFALSGLVERGNNTPFSVNGEDFTVLPEAVITGKLKLGVYARIEGDIVNNGSEKKATNILVAEGSASSGGSGADVSAH